MTQAQAFTAADFLDIQFTAADFLDIQFTDAEWRRFDHQQKKRIRENLRAAMILPKHPDAGRDIKEFTLEQRLRHAIHQAIKENSFATIAFLHGRFLQGRSIKVFDGMDERRLHGSLDARDMAARLQPSLVTRLEELANAPGRPRAHRHAAAIGMTGPA